jgi:NAD(P)-dependent dehydrogenase (short-subunit alcohol dehydrogenase family)
MGAAFVTGGGRGIGRATAIALARAGWDVAVSWNTRSTEARDVVEQIGALGRRGVSVQLTLGDRSSARAALRQVTASLGGLDLLVNNAAMLVQKPWHAISDTEWDEMFAVNLRGVFQLCQEAFPLLETRGGAIINLTSVGGQIGGTLAMHYAASKAGIISLTRSLARVGAPRIRVNAVSPGLIVTEMTAGELQSEGAKAKVQQIPAGRVGEPEDVASTIVFLASPGASYITGQVVGVNGGSHFG